MHVLRSLTVAASDLALLVLLFGPVRAETKVALVIGNENYLHVPHLKTATNDAGLLADTLREDAQPSTGKAGGRQGSAWQSREGPCFIRARTDRGRSAAV